MGIHPTLSPDLISNTLRQNIQLTNKILCHKIRNCIGQFYSSSIVDSPVSVCRSKSRSDVDGRVCGGGESITDDVAVSHLRNLRTLRRRLRGRPYIDESLMSKLTILFYMTTTILKGVETFRFVSLFLSRDLVTKEV